MARKIYWGNYDFEYQLAKLAQLPPRLKRINDEMAFCWTAVANADDQILIDGDGFTDETYSAHLASHGIDCPKFVTSEESNLALQFVPWGWSQEATNKCHDGFSSSPSPLEAVLKLNSRTWAAEQEQERNENEFLSQIVRSEDELQQALLSLSETEDWLLKSNLSMSGRDRIVGTEHSLTTSQMGWASKRFRNNQVLILERRLDAIEEVGILFEVTTEGEPQFVDVLPMLTDRTGRYCGSWLLPQDELIAKWKDEISELQKVATQIQKAGYFGPVGFDVMRYRTAAGEEKTRLFQDVNCRYTMGRLAAGWRRYLNQGEVGCWVHFATRCQTVGALHDWWTNLENSVNTAEGRLLRTAPLSLNGEVVQHQTALLVANSETKVAELQSRLLSANENN